MLAVERRAHDVVMNRDPERELREQIEFAPLRRNGLNRHMHGPLFSKSRGAGEYLLTGVDWAFGNNRDGSSIPPEGIARGVSEQTPDLLNRGVNRGDRTCAQAHSLSTRTVQAIDRYRASLSGQGSRPARRAASQSCMSKVTSRTAVPRDS